METAIEFAGAAIESHLDMGVRLFHDGEMPAAFRFRSQIRFEFVKSLFQRDIEIWLRKNVVGIFLIRPADEFEGLVSAQLFDHL
jgi:hypothetical protein